MGKETKIVYVAGPFRADTSWEIAENVRAAERVGFRVASAGGMPVIPHANTQHFHGTMTGQFWLEGTLELMRRCDAVMLVIGWTRSQGSRAEKAEAERLGIPVFDDVDVLRSWIRMGSVAVYEAPE